MFNSFLNVFLNSIVMLLYCQYYCSFSFIYFVILSFPCFIILTLIALSEFLVLSFSIISDVELICYLLWTIVLYFISFLSHPFFYLPCSKSVYTHILQYVLYWLTLNGSMLVYCFNHYINDISIVTLFEH